MATTRRNFLKSGTMGLVCAGTAAALARVGIGSPVVMSGSPETNAKVLAVFTREAFMKHLNTTFRIRTSLAAVDLTLVSVTDLKASSRTPARIAGRESFSLLFVDSRQIVPLKQETYSVEHKALGTFSLFLVPVGKSTNRHHEAIIIRL